MVRTLEKIESKKNQKVIITLLGEFIEDLSNDMEVLKVGLDAFVTYFC